MITDDLKILLETSSEDNIKRYFYLLLPCNMDCLIILSSDFEFYFFFHYSLSIWDLLQLFHEIASCGLQKS